MSKIFEKLKNYVKSKGSDSIKLVVDAAERFFKEVFSAAQKPETGIESV